MNTLNPNIVEYLISNTGFTKEVLKQTFSLLKDIEETSRQTFKLDEQKFIMFVLRCRQRKWMPNDTASKLAARTVIVYSDSKPEKSTFNFESSSNQFNFEFSEEVKAAMNLMREGKI